MQFSSVFSSVPGTIRLAVFSGLLAGLVVCEPALAAYKDDIAYTALQGELGVLMPDGSNVPVTQGEALSNDAYMPDTAHSDFTGKLITAQSQEGADGTSNHATSVGRHFYGNDTSIAPGITSISAYNAGSWLYSGYLRCCSPVNNGQPLAMGGRVANHSYIADGGSSANADVLRRIDWLAERDEFVQVVGLNNFPDRQPQLSGAFNAIAAGRTDGNHAVGSPVVDGIYTAERTKPDAVAPLATTSIATAVLSAAAALLVETGQREAALSTDPVETFATARDGTIVYNAARAVVVKAAIMAGADRVTYNGSGADITDYRDQPADRTTNGLDRRFGAGQLNIRNSYRIIAAGEQNSADDQPVGGGAIYADGFDYDPHFGGANASNDAASYFFTVDSNYQKLWAALAWNIRIDGGTPSLFDGAATLYDLNLQLYDVSNPVNPVLVAESLSGSENSEHLWVALLKDHDYELRVTATAGQPTFDWPYALAWKIGSPADTDGDGVPNEYDDYPDDSSRWRDDPCSACHQG